MSMGSTTIQAEFEEDRYLVGRFILERARALGVSPHDLIRRVGYPEPRCAQRGVVEGFGGVTAICFAACFATPPGAGPTCFQPSLH
jgi:hypothetical protein